MDPRMYTVDVSTFELLPIGTEFSFVYPKEPPFEDVWRKIDEENYEPTDSNKLVPPGNRNGRRLCSLRQAPVYVRRLQRER